MIIHVTRTAKSLPFVERKVQEMAGQIRITPETMEQRAGQYDNEAQAVSQVIRNMDKLLTTLQDEWEGESSRAYAARFQELRPSFVQAQDLISNIATSLRNTASTLRQTDASIANAFRG